MTPAVSIFIKTWKDDLRWLRYCLRFLEKNWREPSTEIVIMADADCELELSSWQDLGPTIRIVYCEPWRDGYSHAMYAKLCADRSCYGEHVLLLDSDNMLLVPADLKTFKVADRPIIGWVSYFEHFKLFPMSPWQRVTEKLTKMKPWHHYMGWMPALYYADSFEKVRNFVSCQHGGIPFQTLVRSDVEFNYRNFIYHPISVVDYDLMGFVCSMIETERYALRHLSEVGTLPFHQYHSWTMWGEELIAELETKLAADQ
jgi:hypothetical protein